MLLNEKGPRGRGSVVAAVAGVAFAGLAAAGIGASLLARVTAPGIETSDWPAYGGDAGGSRYSALRQIDRQNVDQLRIAWTYRTGDVSDGTRLRRKSKFEATPILFNGLLYLSTPFNRVIALDPATGAERWIYDPHIDRDRKYSEGLVSRGVSAWEDASRPDSSCGRRIFLGTLDARLVALDAVSGAPCSDFGVSGQVDLTRDIGDMVDGEVETGEYQITSPPAVIGDQVVVGSAMGDNRRVALERGSVRAFDARSGELRWSWDPIPRTPSDPGWSDWEPEGARKTGAANAWSVISADVERDLVFVPTGSAAPDYYGGERKGKNSFANSVVALRGSTGELVWHFQVVHHDLWDYDVAAQPALFTLEHGAAQVPALVVATKMGHLFVLNRETGEPLLPVEERPVPKSDIAGEASWPTQPFPVKPPPLHAHNLDTRLAWGISAEDRAQCRSLMSGLRYDGIFTPPSLEGTIVYPGQAGGVNWGSVAVHKERRIGVTAVNRLAAWVQLIPRSSYSEAARAAGQLTDPLDRRFDAQFTEQNGTPYGMSRGWLEAESGLPCIPPPWGTLAAIDLTEGEVLWEVPLGTIPGLEDYPEAAGWGSFSLGGPIVTAGDVVFIAAAMDDYIRAFDIETGAELWKAGLPAGGQATPMTYAVDQVQYVVIAAGGHGGLGTTLGDYVVAFALPD